MTEAAYAKLPEAISGEIDDLLKQAGEANRAGDAAKREELAMKAWDKLPEPKLSWDYYSNVMPRNNMTFFRDTKQFDKALHWLDITRQSYRSTPEAPNPSIEFDAATVYYEMGDRDKAFEIFDKLHKQFKARPFNGKDKKYLDFYLSQKGKK